MKKLYSLLLVCCIYFTQASSTETLFRHNFNSGNNVYVYQPFSAYIGNNTMFTAVLSADYNILSGDYFSIKAAVYNLNGNTLMSVTVPLDSSEHQPTLFDLGKTVDGGYYIYWASALADTINSYTELTLLKLNSNGTQAWNTRVTMPDFSYITGSPIKVRQNSLGDFYLNGNADHTMTICKISSTGNFGWGKTITFDPNNKNPLPDVTLNGDTEAIVCSNPSQAQSAYVALDANGNIKWAKNYLISGSYTTPTVIIPTMDNNYTAGNIIGYNGTSIWKLSSTGDILWRKIYNCAGYQFKMIEMNDGTLMGVVSGQNFPSTMLHLDAGGNILEKKIILGGSSTSIVELIKDGNQFVLTAAVTIPSDTVPYTLVIKASDLSDLCETLNLPLTVSADPNNYTLIGTETDLIVNPLTSDNATTLTVSNTPPYSVAANNYCSYMLPVTEVSNDARVLIFPVPATGELTIQLAEPPTGAAYVKLFDISGKLVLEQNIQSKQTVLPVYSLAGGVYLAEIKTGNAVIIRRIVKM